MRTTISAVHHASPVSVRRKAHIGQYVRTMYWPESFEFLSNLYDCPIITKKRDARLSCAIPGHVLAMLSIGDSRQRKFASPLRT